jgi:hypothetical protein
VPYAQDGVGDVCVQATSLCDYINSWGVTTLEINGNLYTNQWADGDSIPPENGVYVIHYVSTNPSGHFEISGPCSGATATNTPVGPTATFTRTATPTPTFTRTPTSSGSDLWIKYNFDGNANDSSGGGRNGTLNNSPAFVTGKIGQAVDLNGSNQYVSLPSGSLSSLSNFSVAAWVKLDTTSAWRRIFDFGTGTSVYMFLAPTNGSVVRFAITTGGGSAEQRIDGTAALPTGTWKHVAVTKNGNTGILYVDGAQVGQNTNLTLGPNSLGSTNNNWIGRSQYSADPYLDGQVDDFRIYNRALSASEVSALFAAAPTAPPPPPTAPPPPTTPPAPPTKTGDGGG